MLARNPELITKNKKNSNFVTATPPWNKILSWVYHWDLKLVSDQQTRTDRFIRVIF